MCRTKVYGSVKWQGDSVKEKSKKNPGKEIIVRKKTVSDKAELDEKK